MLHKACEGWVAHPRSFVGRFLVVHADSTRIIVQKTIVLPRRDVPSYVVKRGERWVSFELTEVVVGDRVASPVDSSSYCWRVSGSGEGGELTLIDQRHLFPKDFADWEFARPQ